MRTWVVALICALGTCAAGTPSATGVAFAKDGYECMTWDQFGRCLRLPERYPACRGDIF